MSFLQQLYKVVGVLAIAASIAFMPSGVAAQDTLKEVKVSAHPAISGDDRVAQFVPGQKITSIGKLVMQQYQMNSMAQLLAQQTPVFIKSYGFNGLATLHFRGASSAQSAVYWNGVPLQNAALGMADLSTLPVLFLKRVNIVYGGSGALWGSGNVGGALLLETDMPAPSDSAKKQLSLIAGTGSFGQYQGGITAGYSHKGLGIDGQLFFQSAANDFRYTGKTGQEQRMQNSRLGSGAAMLHAMHKGSKGQTVRLSAWYQQYDRELPPALFEPQSQKRQVDKSLRLLGQWEQTRKLVTWHLKSSWIRDEITYTDPMVLLQASNGVYQYFQEAGAKMDGGKLGKLLLAMPLQLAWMEGAHQQQQQLRVAVVAAYQLPLWQERVSVAVNGRAERINEVQVVLPGSSLSWQATRWLAFRANVQRTYRVPTLNELYYAPGGNTNLKPERGWVQDVGYAAKGTVGKLHLNHDLALYNRNIHDWILWLGGAIWTPHNIALVHSRGVETENQVSWTIGKCVLHLAVNTAYVLSTTTSSYLPGDGTTGKQLPYTPRYNGQGNVGLARKWLYLNYNHTYTGYRFVTMDESAWVTPYQTGSIQLACQLPTKQHQVQLTAQCNNVWNAQYQVVAYRPMPGINWLMGIKASL